MYLDLSPILIVLIVSIVVLLILVFYLILIFSFVLNRYFLKPIQNLVNYTNKIKNKDNRKINIDNLKIRNAGTRGVDVETNSANVRIIGFHITNSDLTGNKATAIRVQSGATNTVISGGFITSGMSIGDSEPSTTVLRDIYMTIGEQLDDGSWIVNIQINYLIRWIWISAMLMGFAGLMLIVSKRYKT